MFLESHKGLAGDWFIMSGVGNSADEGVLAAEVAARAERERLETRLKHYNAAKKSLGILKSMLGNTELNTKETAAPALPPTEPFLHPSATVEYNPVTHAKRVVSTKFIPAGTIISAEPVLCALPASVTTVGTVALEQAASSRHSKKRGSALRKLSAQYLDRMLYGTAPESVQRVVHATHPTALVAAFKGLAGVFTSSGFANDNKSSVSSALARMWDRCAQVSFNMHSDQPVSVEVGLLITLLMTLLEEASLQPVGGSDVGGPGVGQSRKRKTVAKPDAVFERAVTWAKTAHPHVWSRIVYLHRAESAGSAHIGWFQDIKTTLQSLLPPAMYNVVESRAVDAFCLCWCMNYLHVPIFVADIYTWPEQSEAPTDADGVANHGDGHDQHSARQRGAKPGASHSFFGGFMCLGYALLDGKHGIFHALEHSCAPNVTRHAVGDWYYTITVCDVDAETPLTANWADTTRAYTPELGSMSACNVMRDSAMRDAPVMHLNTGPKPMNFRSLAPAADIAQADVAAAAIAAERERTRCRCAYCEESRLCERATRALRDDTLGAVVMPVVPASRDTPPSDPELRSFCLTKKCFPDQLYDIAAEYAQVNAYFKKHSDSLLLPDTAVPELLVLRYNRFDPQTIQHWRQMYAERGLFLSKVPVGIIENHAAWIWALCASRFPVTTNYNTVAMMMMTPVMHSKSYLDQYLSNATPESWRKVDFRGGVTALAIAIVDMAPAAWLAMQSAVQVSQFQIADLRKQHAELVKSRGPLHADAEDEFRTKEHGLATSLSYQLGAVVDLLLAYHTAATTLCGGNERMATHMAVNTCKQSVFSRLALEQSVEHLQSALDRTHKEATELLQSQLLHQTKAKGLDNA